MNAHVSVDRRRFVVATLSAAALAGVPWLASPDVASALRAPSAAARLAGLLSRVAGAHRVGLGYLQVAPGERDATRLAALLTESLRIDADAIARLDERALRRTVARRVRADFADGRTVGVDGWVLSTTEARLCALAALRRTA